jgi:hypothetical protein
LSYCRSTVKNNFLTMYIANVFFPIFVHISTNNVLTVRQCS